MSIFQRKPIKSIPKDSSFLRRRLFMTREALLGVWVLPARVKLASQNLQFSTLRHRLSLGSRSRARLSLAHRIQIFLLSILVLSGLFVLIFVNAPDWYYRLMPSGAVAIIPQQLGSPLGGRFDRSVDQVSDLQPGSADTQLTPTPTPTPYQPAFNPNLPEGDWLEIPRIGVRSQMVATEDPAEALATGLWLVPDYGRAGDRSLPMIVAAHRFGWDWWWQSDYWQYHSFNRLPETEPGDLVEVIADQRKWTYEIYAGEENDEITDYSADLILYTCKFLNSPIRFVRYARLIDPTTNTQATTLDQAGSGDGQST